ncbi:hypothetical protein SRABI83_01395 [Arthrobacter sp. Bi83]|uniref:hypothetical protein n=1 Tax=Arthrobacter sp. Bi83 TaxID=2822353 RepID=UPI001D3D75B0|nr:hypothetical protein [Arthrobacter sp. Bi83]CAH0179564.1 hypothetical protein SRABI83_01395 [Arthrobacter sp. Bi83]
MPAGWWLQQMADGNRPVKNFPDRDTLSAMAKGLAVTEAEVIPASAGSLGFQMDRTGAGELHIPGAGFCPTTPNGDHECAAGIDERPPH